MDEMKALEMAQRLFPDNKIGMSLTMNSGDSHPSVVVTAMNQAGTHYGAGHTWHEAIIDLAVNYYVEDMPIPSL